jgi:hypothetical protein
VAKILDPAPRKGNDPDSELGASMKPIDYRDASLNAMSPDGECVNPNLDQSRTVSSEQIISNIIAVEREK